MNENIIAIKMLRIITDLLRAIEYDDRNYIKNNINNLERYIIEFKNVDKVNIASEILEDLLNSKCLTPNIINKVAINFPEILCEMYNFKTARCALCKIISK